LPLSLLLLLLLPLLLLLVAQSRQPRGGCLQRG
jgi:hypothetical protein